MDSTTTSPANVVIMAWSSRPERMSSWLSTATMMPMAAILKIRSMSIHIPPYLSSEAEDGRRQSGSKSQLVTQFQLRAGVFLRLL